MIRPIFKYPAPVLQQLSEAVTCFDESIQQMVQDMVETMYAAPGIGLAAPQIGILKRVIAIDLSTGSEEGKLLVAVNPEILTKDGEQYGEEGCLSVPDFYESVWCPQKISLRAQDVQGNYWTMEAEDLLARCLCHEMDHLRGILFIDRLSPLKRSLIKRKLKKKASQTGR